MTQQGKLRTWLRTLTDSRPEERQSPRETWDLTGGYDYARLIAEEKEHYSEIEVTEKLTEGGIHAHDSWAYYWERVAGRIAAAQVPPLDELLEHRRGDPGRQLRVLSLGSGYCGHEIALARALRPPYRILCADLNEDLFAKARDVVSEERLSMDFVHCDLNFMEIERGAWDLIFAHASLHHVINLEHLFEQIEGGLSRAGLFHLVEVVGQNRRLLWEDNERFLNHLLAALPEAVTNGIRVHAQEDQEGMEGVRQEALLPFVAQHFEPVFELHHGAFMRFVCTYDPLGKLLSPGDPLARRWLDLLIDVDESAVAHGLLRPLEVWGIYRRRDAEPGATTADPDRDHLHQESSMTQPIITLDEVLADAPRFHRDAAGEPISWGISGDVLHFINERVSETSRTLETGAGLSTVVFAMRRSNHICLVPEQLEVDLIQQYCASHSIPTDQLSFRVGNSEAILPTLSLSSLDLVLIDGRHAFPTPFIDWYYTATALKIGGILIVDDTQLWTGAVLRSFLAEEPEWQLEHDFGKTAVFKKVDEGSHIKEWNQQPFVARQVGSSELHSLGHLPALTDLHQQVAGLQQQVVRIQQGLDAIDLDLNMRRRTLNETTAASQAVQLLLRQKYRELLSNRLPLPELADTEFRCFSQNGEDGILLYTFTILGTTNKRAVEICAGDGIECNAANLIINHGWYGLLFDGDEHNIVRGKDFYSKCQDTFAAPPTLIASWITAENINSLVEDNGFAGDVDLLSLDMDGMDYWVWRAIQCISPRVVILEFNPVWGPDRAVSVPYQADFRMDFGRWPYYASASLSAFVKLGRVKGYRFVGTQRLGFNALFVRSGVGEDLLPEVSPGECFQRHPILRAWGPHWIPDVSERPEWKNIVEV